MAMFAIAGMFVDFLIVRPVAFLLSHERLSAVIKVASLLLLGLGFHFDLLSS
jgi:hypothetical protein